MNPTTETTAPSCSGYNPLRPGAEWICRDSGDASPATHYLLIGQSLGDPSRSTNHYRATLSNVVDYTRSHSPQRATHCAACAIAIAEGLKAAVDKAAEDRKYAKECRLREVVSYDEIVVDCGRNYASYTKDAAKAADEAADKEPGTYWHREAARLGAIAQLELGSMGEYAQKSLASYDRAHESRTLVSFMSSDMREQLAKLYSTMMEIRAPRKLGSKYRKLGSK